MSQDESTKEYKHLDALEQYEQAFAELESIPASNKSRDDFYKLGFYPGGYWTSGDEHPALARKSQMNVFEEPRMDMKLPSVWSKIETRHEGHHEIDIYDDDGRQRVTIEVIEGITANREDKLTRRFENRFHPRFEAVRGFMGHNLSEHHIPKNWIRHFTTEEELRTRPDFIGVLDRSAYHQPRVLCEIMLPQITLGAFSTQVTAIFHNREAVIAEALLTLERALLLHFPDAKDSFSGGRRWDRMPNETEALVSTLDKACQQLKEKLGFQDAVDMVKPYYGPVYRFYNHNQPRLYL